MTIEDLLPPNSVLIQLRAASKAKALDEREKLGSTGFGGGVAVPHARLVGLLRPVAAFARLARPIDFQAIDEKPVDLVFMLLTPAGDEKRHLTALAGVSRLMRDASRCARLRKAASSAALLELLSEAS